MIDQGGGLAIGWQIFAEPTNGASSAQFTGLASAAAGGLRRKQSRENE